jgi:hypothetical protein
MFLEPELRMRVDIAPPIRQVVMKFRNALNDSHCRSPLLGRLKQSHRATGGLQLRPNAALDRIAGRSIPRSEPIAANKPACLIRPESHFTSKTVTPRFNRARS